MTMATEAMPQAISTAVRPGDRVRVLDAPSWCRRYFAGKAGSVVRTLPFAGGDVWVRFEQPVRPWCERMDAVEEFPFAPDHLAAA
jgi:hypothetical protein